MKTILIYGLVWALLVGFSVRLQAAEPAEVSYTCPMHPHYIAQEMGSCPICGMDLVPLESGPTPSSVQGAGPEAAGVTIAPETIQNMGVRYGRAEQTLFGRRIRAYGVVAENERLRIEVSSRVAGWIEELGVTAVGDQVSSGMLLYRLFSPDLVAAQRDYLSARERQSSERIDSAAVRLNALGVPRSLLRQLDEGRELFERVPFYATGAGTLSELRVREGSYVKPGETLAVVQDYSSVWINAAVAEKDLSAITPDTQVRVILPNLPGRVLETKVEYIHPTLDPASRTGTVRLLLDNQDGLLRPGAYADVLFEVGARQRLAVPSSAILSGSDGPYVILAAGEGHFQPQRIDTGHTSGGFTEILAGLDAEQRIVLSGQFLIDSESSLRESFRKLQRLKQGLDELAVSDSQLAMIDHLVDGAIYIHESLVDGYDLNPKHLQPAREIRDLLWAAFGQTRLGRVLEGAEEAIGEAQQAPTHSALKEALHRLSLALQPWIQQGRPRHYADQGLNIYRDEEDQRLWLQLGDRPFSPYGGKGVRLEGPSHD